MKQAEIYVEHPVFAVNNTFTYWCQDDIRVGQRVLVPFNMQEIIGLVYEVHEPREHSYELKHVIRPIDERVLLNDELYALARWLAKETVSPYMACIQAMLPTLLKPRGTDHQVKQIRMIAFVHYAPSLSVKQTEALQFLQAGDMPYAAMRARYPHVAKVLLDKGCARCYEVESRAVITSLKEAAPALTLNAEQTLVVETIAAKQHHCVMLLHGVTGSGKTEVFLQNAARVTAQGKQVLFLVPEISLTSQMIERVKARFPSSTAIYHSRLSNQERYEQYQLVLDGLVQIVVGTRSAVFLPFTNIGLIILDEEHDKSYKQESKPRYHARDVAIQRAKIHDCPVLLASATPSFESYARAVKKVYDLLVLPNRVNDTLPTCHIVDMAQEIQAHHRGRLSRALFAAMRTALERQEQVILLLNRRGYVPILRCRKCKEVLMCPHCDIALSYHKERERLKCHICDYEQAYPNACTHCHHGEFEWLGYGIQRLEEELCQQFPSARIMRMDKDTTSRKNGHSTIIQAFQKHEADILIGTQMIAKGLDFSDVTVVGILNADAGLYRSDFRAIEDTFQMISQACGRSGRFDKPGLVFIQTFDTAHYALTFAAKNDYKAFFHKEMQYRHMGEYPPYCFLASIVMEDKNDERLKEKMSEVHTMVKSIAQAQDKIYGPSELLKVKDFYRRRILIKSKDIQRLNSILHRLVEHYQGSRTILELDMHPLSLE